MVWFSVVIIFCANSIDFTVLLLDLSAWRSCITFFHSHLHFVWHLSFSELVWTLVLCTLC